MQQKRKSGAFSTCLRHNVRLCPLFLETLLGKRRHCVSNGDASIGGSGTGNTSSRAKNARTHARILEAFEYSQQQNVAPRSSQRLGKQEAPAAALLSHASENAGLRKSPEADRAPFVW